MTQSACDTCAYYSYDEDYECYVCDMDLDEDELVRFLSDTHYNCPYYRNGDEYAVVRKQIQAPILIGSNSAYFTKVPIKFVTYS